ITLLSTFSQPKIDSELVVNTGNQISSASAGQPEPMLAVGIILVKAFKMDEALEVFDQTRLQHPSRLLAHQGVTWIHLYKRRYDRATETLAEMLDQIPVPEEGEVYSPTVLKKFAWIGSVRELSGSSMEWVEDKIPDATVLARCDELVARHSKAAQAAYQSGRVPIREKINELTASLESDPSANADLLRNRVKTYNIPVATEESIQEIRDGLDLD
ncbi:MAG: hypothetical protein P8M80_02255, partial [Pirellulaceae bacterium]|nr:hypothetical protein [Pirellulaceae bacterium]